MKTFKEIKDVQDIIQTINDLKFLLKSTDKDPMAEDFDRTINSFISKWNLQNLLIESSDPQQHPKHCLWWGDWHQCNCGLFDNE